MEQRLSVEGMSIVVRSPDDWDRKTSVILGHGAGQNMDSPFMSYFHSGLAGLGLLSVKFNFPYMESGRKAPDHQTKLRASYRAVIDQIGDAFDPGRFLIGGKSMGGRVSSYIAGEFERVAGLVFLGYPLHPPGRTDKLRDEHLYELSKPMLFVSGTRDTLAKRDLLDLVVSRIGKRATLHWIEGGDHSLRVKKREKESLSEALEVIDQWTARI